MKPNPRRRYVLTLVATASVILGACATPVASTVPEASAPTDSTAPEVSSVPDIGGGIPNPDAARVNLWHTIPTDTETFFVGQLLPRFTAQHPECNIVARNLGVEDASIVATGLALPLEDANRPHLWWIASSETGAYVEADVLADVDTWLGSHPDIKSNIIPSLLELSSWEGKVRSLPWMTNNTAMWINVDAFEAAGIPIPSQDPEATWTWAEFQDAAAKLSAGGKKGFLETINTGWDFWTYHAWYGAAGGDVSGLAKLSSPESIKVLQFHKDLVEAGYTTTTPTGWDAAPWYAGEVAITANGPWNFPKLSAFTDFKFTVVPYPRDVKPATNLGGDQLFIGKTPTPAQEACAFAFGEYVLTDEFQIAFQKQSGNLPVTTSAAESDEYQAHLEQYPFLYGFVNQTPFGVSRPPLPQFGEIATAFTPAWDAVILEGADVTTELTELQANVDEILAQ